MKTCLGHIGKAAATIALAVSAAHAQNVAPGLDLFKTPAPPPGETTTGTLADFSATPIPADFFCPPNGSAFTGQIYFKGQSIDNFDFRWRTTDTVVRRLNTANLPSIGSQATVPIEIVALSLVGVQPVIVGCPAGEDSWTVKVCLSTAPQQQGSMTIKKLDATGGTFNSTLPVYAKFTFTNTNTFIVKEFDAGPPAPPVVFTASNVPWSYNVPAGSGLITVPAGLPVDKSCNGNVTFLPVGTSNFHPGVAFAHPNIAGWQQTPVVYSVYASLSITLAEGLLQPDPGHPPPNDVYGLWNTTIFGLQRGAELFQSSGAVLGAPPDKTNVDRMSASWGAGPDPGGPPFRGPFYPSPGGAFPVRLGGDPPGTLGLVPSDDISALSFGRDGGSILVFSVSRQSRGLPDSAVEFQRMLSPPAPVLGATPSTCGGDPGNELGADLFSSQVLAPFGGVVGPPFPPVAPAGFNLLYLDELDLGLQAPSRHCGFGTDGEDDLDAVELSDMAVVDPNLDGVPDYGDKLVFFALSSGPSLVAPVTRDDILVSTPGFTGAFQIYADGVTNIGLLAGDRLTSLVLWDAGGPNGFLDAGDEALFTLHPSSPSLVAGANPNMPAGAHSAADVFRTSFVPVPGGITVYATAAMLGLDADDLIDALDIGGVWHGGPWQKLYTREDALFAKHGCVPPQCLDSQCALPDRDVDGIPDDADNAPYLPNHLQEDADADRVGDVSDNCPSVANPDQRDTDGNHVGDACDTIPPVITNVAADVTGSSVNISWTTNEAADSRIHYGTTPPGSLLTSDGAFVAAHTVDVAGLDACATYYYWVESKDVSGNTTINDNGGSYYTFQTGVIQARSYVGGPVPIPDNNPTGAVATINVPDTQTIQDLNVKLSVTHTWDGDLTLSLIGPDGTTAILSSRRGAFGDNFNNTVFDDQAPALIANGLSPFAAAFRPDVDLSIFNGKNPAGTWTLKAVDSFATDIGTINAFQVSFGFAPACGSFLQHQANALVDTCNGTGTGGGNGVVDPGEDVSVQVTLLNNGTAPVTGISATLSSPTPGVVVSSGASSYPDLNPGQSAAGNVPFAFSVAASVPCDTVINLQVTATGNEGGWSDSFSTQLGLMTRTYVGTGLPQPIPDDATVVMAPVSVTQAGTVTDVNVGVTLHHTRDSDLYVSLLRPAGSGPTLSSRRGGNGDHFLGTVFDDEGPVPIALGAAPFTGTFRPDGALSFVDAIPASGTWNLFVQDVAVGQTGTVDAWSLEVTSSGACSPCTGVTPPAEVAALSWVGTNRDTLQWSSATRANFYEVGRGNGADLALLLNAGADSCTRVSTTALSSAGITEIPGLGSIHWYLARGFNSAGLGPSGNATAGARLQNSSGACP